MARGKQGCWKCHKGGHEKAECPVKLAGAVRRARLYEGYGLIRHRGHSRGNFSLRGIDKVELGSESSCSGCLTCLMGAEPADTSPLNMESLSVFLAGVVISVVLCRVLSGFKASC